MDLANVEHGVLLEALVNDVPGGAKPDRVDLSVDVAEFQSLLEVPDAETEVLKEVQVSSAVLEVLATKSVKS